MSQLSLASDKISKLRHPVLLLQLSLYQNEKSKSCSVTLELTKEELDQLIATLDVVNTVRTDLWGTIRTIEKRKQTSFTKLKASSATFQELQKLKA